MSDMISETGQRLFAAHAEAAFAGMPECAEDGASPWQTELWQDIEAAGMPLALLAEADGGFDLTPLEAFGLVRLAAAHALPTALGETLLANWLLAAAGLPLAEGPASLACGLVARRDGDAWQIQGRAPRSPFGRHARVVVALAHDADGGRWLLRLPPVQHTPGYNVAAEARDDLHVAQELPASAVAPAPVDDTTWLALGALLRSQGLAGAQEAILSLCVDYANERQQFGRPIGKFQAVQHHLAVMAGEVATARAAADFAAGRLPQALAEPEAFVFAAATAKLRSGEAAGRVAALAHQVHGAIGFSREYRLHPLTRRLWAWREEYGAEAFWAEHLGTLFCAAGPTALWPGITREPRGEAA